MAQIHCESLLSSLDQMATNPQTKPNNLACESAGRLLLSTSTITILLLLSQICYSFYRPMDGARLSQPRHCSTGVQPVIN